jgi:hypothetical protein
LPYARFVTAYRNAGQWTHTYTVRQF